MAAARASIAAIAFIGLAVWILSQALKQKGDAAGWVGAFAFFAFLAAVLFATQAVNAS